MPNIEDNFSENIVGNDENLIGNDDNFSDNVVGNDDNNIGNDDNNIGVVGNDENVIGNDDNTVVTDNNVAVDSGNTEDSGNTATDSFNDTDVDIDVEDTGNTDSYNDTEVDIEDSGNTDSYNDSYTDSFNDYTLIDDSVTVGVRQYNTNVGNDYHFAGLAGKASVAAAAAGSLHVDNRVTVTDQSVNQNIDADGPVFQAFGQTANVASGDSSVAAGDDAYVDNSSTDIEVGDVYIGNTWTDISIDDSFQDNSTNEWTEYELEIDDSFNDFSDETNVDVDIEDAFNEYEYTEVDTEVDWENSGNLFSPFGDANQVDL